MAGIVSLQILFAPKGRYQYVILVEIVVIGLSLAYSQLLIFPSVVGIDPWWHQAFTLHMLEKGIVPEGYDYSRLPVFHIFVGSTSLIVNSSYKMAAMLSGSSVQVICSVLFVFLLGRFIVNDKVGLLASLLLVVANTHICYSYWMIPNSVAVIFILITVYLLLRIRKRESKVAISLSILSMTVLILTHTLTAMVLAIFLFALWTGFQVHGRLCQKKITPPVTLPISIFFAVAMFSWWIYASGHIVRLAKSIEWAFSVDFALRAVPEGIVAYPYHIPLSEQVFNNLGMSLFFAISFLGCFYMISKRFGSRYSFAFAFAGVLVLATAFFSLITGHYIIENRWWYVSQTVLSIPFALAILMLVGQARSKLRKASLMIVLVTIPSFLMIMSPVANIDNSTFSPNTSVRYALVDSELQAAIRLSGITDPEGIAMDSYYGRFLHSPIVGITLEMDERLYDGNFSSCDDMILLIRKEIIEHPSHLMGRTYKLDYDPRVVLEKQGFSRIYDSGSVIGFRRGH